MPGIPWCFPLALPTSSLARPQQTLNKAYLVPMQLTFNMSDVMVFKGISRGSCMSTSCSSARIQGKSYEGNQVRR